MKLFEKLKKAIEKQISYDEILSLGSSRRRLQYFGAFLIESYKSTMRHQTITAASALSFKTIVALVPLIFIGIAVASMLGISESENYVNSFLDSIETKIPDVPELKPLLEVIRSFAEKAKEIVGLSFIVLFYIAYSLLSNIEKAFNNIWQVERKRRFLNRVVAYFAAIIIIPILMSFSVYLNSRVEVATVKMARSIEETKNEAYELIVSHLPGSDDDEKKAEEGHESTVVATADESQQSILVKVILGLVSLFLTSLAVAILIIFMPFTRVKIWPALIAGVCSGVVLELMKFAFSLYVNYSASNLTRLYGSSLLVLPLFLLWVWMVWTVILLGAEIAFNIQNYYDLVVISHLRKKGYEHQLYLSVMVMVCICRGFYNGEISVGIVDKLSSHYSVPPLIIRNIIQKLQEAGLVIEVKSVVDAYSPAKDIAHINLHDVYMAMNDIEFSVITEIDSAAHDKVEAVFSEVGDVINSELQGMNMLELVKHEPGEK